MDIFAWLFKNRKVQDKKIEHQLKMTHDNLSFALQSGRMGTWDIDLENNSLICSQEMLDLWGITCEEFDQERSTLQKKVHPEDVAKMSVAIEQAIHSDGLYELEYRIFPTPQNMRWVLSRGRCTFDPGSHKPTRFSGVVFDITERKNYEESLSRAIRARDQFLTIAGHELKTPLTNMQLLLQLRQRDLKRGNLDPFKPEMLAEVLDEQFGYVRRMSDLVDNMLNVSQIAEGRLSLKKEVFDILKLTQEVIQRIRMSLDFPSIQLQVSEDLQSVVGEWDQFRIEQALTNLLVNAVKYGNKKPVQVEVSVVNNHVHIAVKDHGLGIAPEDQERVFERFERGISENEVCGLGLGLYIARSFVQLHGGEIHLKTVVGQGSEFTVELPLPRGRA